MLVAAVIAIGAGVFQTQSGDQTLGTYSLLDQNVKAVVPSGWPAPMVPYVDFNGRHYRVVPDRGYRIDNDWSEVKGLYDKNAPAAEGSGVDWHAKLVIMTRSNILDRSSTNLYRFRRTYLDNAEIAATLKEFALFCAMVEAYGDGHVRIKPDIELENEVMYFTSPDELPFGPDFAKSYFAGRINGGGYLAEDKVYRGPYQSVFYVHAGLTNDLQETTVNNSPVTGIPFYRYYDNDRLGELARVEFNCWVKDLVFAAQRHGYRLFDGLPQIEVPKKFDSFPTQISDPVGIVRPGMWKTLVSSDTTDYPTHLSSPKPSSLSLADIAEEPWSKLPIVDSSAGVRAADLDYLRSGSADAKVEGYAGYGSELKVKMSVATPPSAGNSVNPQPYPDQPVALTFDPGQAENLQKSGYVTSVSVNDSERQAVAQIRFEGNAERGWIRLIGRDDAKAVADLNDTPFLDFWVKPKFAAPLELTVVGDGWRTAVRLFGDILPPAENGRIALNGSANMPVKFSSGGVSYENDPTEGTAIDLAIKREEVWQHVIVDLRTLVPHGSKSGLRGVYVCPNPSAPLMEPLRPQWPVLFLDDLKLTKEASAALTPTTPPDPIAPNPIGETPESRMAFAASVGEGADSQTKTALLALLKDKIETVVTNAAAAYTRIKDPSAVPALADVSRSFNPFGAEMAIKALAYQDTEPAWTAIKTAVERGPFDFTKMFAVAPLGAKGDPKLAGLITLLTEARSYKARFAAAQAIAQLKGPNMDRVLLYFTNQDNPEIRLYVMDRLNPDNEAIIKRILWYSVNDASDAVRAAAYGRLLQSTVKGMAAEGYKGFKDDSHLTRILLLSRITKPGEDLRGPIKGALTDTDAEVRTAALQAFKGFQTVGQDDISTVFDDKDPRVQFALIELAQAKGIKLPTQTLDALKNSPDPLVAEKAKSLGQS